MIEKTFDAAAHVAHMEAMLDLPIADAWRPAVIAHVAAIAKAADLVMSAPLLPEADPAFVFEA
jgi:hypothetical protein